jgi:glycine betaine catabolism B
MIMKNNDNKKSAKLWTHQLFKQASTPKTAPSGKTYFAHRYHQDGVGLAQIPFSTFFSDAGEHQDNLNSDALNSHALGEHDFVALERNLDADEFQDKGKNGSLTSVNGFDMASSIAESAQFTVLNCYDETSDTKTFRLGRLDGQVFDYLPGQYITLSVVISGQEHKRSYSLASTSSHPGVLEITVKRSPKGVVSNWLNDYLKVGDTLNVKGPYGKFSCAKRSTPQKILFLAAGSGIVPIMSMLRWLADTEAQVDVTLLLSFQALYDIIYCQELHLIAARHKNIKLFITLTKEPSVLNQWTGLLGRINEKMLNALVPDLPERAVYLCGPDAFMEDCKYYLQKLKLPAEHLFCESFTVNSTQPIVPTMDQTISQTKAQASIQTSTIGRPSKNTTGNYRIRFAKSSKTIVADGSVSLLELAEQSGISIDHECRAGNCGECMVKCLKGSVEMTEQAEIANFDRKKGWVYACCAYPTSNAVLDA